MPRIRAISASGALQREMSARTLASLELGACREAPNPRLEPTRASRSPSARAPRVRLNRTVRHPKGSWMVGYDPKKLDMTLLWS